MEQVHDIKEAVALYDKGLSNLLGNATEWKEFLKFNSKFYKYKFHENLLLYAQDKNITACATFDEWKKVGRYVKPKPYSKTLKTIYQQNGRLYLKSVFDISSTNSKYDVDFKLWETTETETINILSNKLDIYLGNTQGKLSNIISSYLSDMIVNNELAETLELSKEQIYNDEFLSAFFESVITVVMNRCGAEYEPNLDTFENINDVQILKKLGYIVNKCSYDLIRIVELEIKEKLKKQEWEELFNERNNIKENEQNIGGNKTSEISRIDNDGNNKRDTRKLFSRDSESRTTNRRTIKNKISKTRYGRIYRTSTIRKHDTQLKNGTNEQYDRRKSKRNVDYGDGVVQTTLFNLPQINEELKKQTPVENTFSGYKVGDLVYLENDKPQYIKKIDVEKNQVLVSINPHTDVVLQRYSIQDFEDKLYNNSLNATSIENNKENDLEKLAEITEINPFTENDEMVQIPPPPAPFKISDDLKKDSIGLKKKYDENIAAIKLLKQLEQEDREATDEEYTAIETDLHTYTNDYRNGTSYKDEYYSDAATGLTSEKYTELKQKMLKSVYQNGGFYIGKYETGIENAPKTSGSSSTAPTETPVIKPNAYPYNLVTCSQAQTLASNMESGNYTSSLMFGVQWDLVLKYLETKGTAQADLKEDSTNWGNYSGNLWNITNANSKYAILNTSNYILGDWTSGAYGAKGSSSRILLSTGASDTFSKQGIYDLAGNVWEWTLEYTSYSSAPCAYRGGSCFSGGGTYPAVGRNSFNATDYNGDVGFRGALY